MRIRLLGQYWSSLPRVNGFQPQGTLIYTKNFISNTKGCSKNIIWSSCDSWNSWGTDSINLWWRKPMISSWRWKRYCSRITLRHVSITRTKWMPKVWATRKIPKIIRTMAKYPNLMWSKRELHWGFKTSLKCILALKVRHHAITFAETLK